ncbi:PAS domain S-box protein [bacterium]|nr:MAG: PAS domain S-box protein [bacterium]
MPAHPAVTLRRTLTVARVPQTKKPQVVHQASLAAARDHAVIAAALDPILTIDIKGTILSVSDSVRRVFGWTPAELVGRNVNVLMPEPHHSAHDQHLARYRRSGKTTTLGCSREFEGVRKSGVRFPIEISVARVDVAKGEPPLLVSIIRDVSDRKRVESELAEYRRLLEARVQDRTRSLVQSQQKLRLADRLASIGTLAAGLGHDMNNVLLPVRAHLNALRSQQRSAEASDAARSHIDAVSKSVAYLQQLADGLHFLAMDPDKDIGAQVPLDLATWWARIGTLISKAVPKHVRVLASIPSSVPPVCVASAGLIQAVLNLVVNAGEAIPPRRKRRQGLIRVTATLTTDTAAVPHVRLTVSDNGRGMTDETKRRAFEMFFTTKPRGLGTGMGLALVHKVVLDAGGHVEIESSVDKGTAVSMYLPVAPATPLSGRARTRTRNTVAYTSIADGRSASLVRQVLDASGVTQYDVHARHEADLWVIEPLDKYRAQARAWRAARAHGTLILYGTPACGTANAWSSLHPDIISDTTDMESIRAAIARANDIP